MVLILLLFFKRVIALRVFIEFQVYINLTFTGYKAHTYTHRGNVKRVEFVNCLA